jgi:uncharacterized protein (DUF1501 family)
MSKNDQSKLPAVNVSRRQILKAAGYGAALSLLPTLAVSRAYAYSTAAADGRFVLIFLRGGMDGLFCFAPVSDPTLASLRPSISQKIITQGISLAGTGFAVHPAAANLADLFLAKELLFCPTAGTTDASRSHFQAQDLFEIGSGTAHGGSGFMARLAQTLGHQHSGNGAISFTREVPLTFQGTETPPEIAPLSGSGLKLPNGNVLEAIRNSHAGLKSGEAIDQAIATQAEIDATVDMEGAARGAPPANGFPKIAGHMGRILKSNRRLSVSFIDLGGVDTHVGEEGMLSRALQSLSEGIIALKNSLGPAEWQRTRVAVMSEFGRTVHENGTQGTDHGHGGLFLLAGGDIDGRRMLGDFPGLSTAALHQQRDLPVLADWRQLLGETVISTFGIRDRTVQDIFPGRPKETVGI